MGLHPALEVKRFDTYGFSCRGLFVKDGHRIRRGEKVWWYDRINDAPFCNYTKNDILNAPSTPTSLHELESIVQSSYYAHPASTVNASIGEQAKTDQIVENPRSTLITYAYMLDDDCYGSTLCPDDHDVAYYYNHSCAPNTVYQGDDFILALRDIEAGEQVVYDYAFTETQDSLHVGMDCKCGSPNCRGKLDFLQYKDPTFIAEHYDHCSTFIQRKMRENGWVHDGIVRRCHSIGMNEAGGISNISYGLYACQHIPRLTPIIVFSGKIVTGKDIERVSHRFQEMCLQIDTDMWQVPNTVHSSVATFIDEVIGMDGQNLTMETGDYLQHSCNPNCGMLDAVRVVTMRDIAPNEAITIDYAMVNTGEKNIPAETFTCHCGGNKGDDSLAVHPCRGTITAQDYKVVGGRYEGFLSPFVRLAYQRYMNGNSPPPSHCASVTSSASLSSENSADFDSGADE